MEEGDESERHVTSEEIWGMPCWRVQPAAVVSEEANDKGLRMPAGSLLKLEKPRKYSLQEPLKETHC